MNTTHYYLAAVVLVLLIWRAYAAVKRCRERKQRDFQRKLETILLPRETVKAVCPQKKGRWVLTSRRLLAETKKGFIALDIKSVKSAYGITSDGKRTTDPKKMTQFIIKAGSEHRLQNTGADFEAVARQLSAMLKQRRNKKK